MKFQYPITVDYVSDWTIREAIREIVANGLDGETALGAKFSAWHDPKKEILHLVNENVKVDVKALYFGGTSKSGDRRLIGQYGEGLKIAMLVFARMGMKVVIRNGDEVWTPSIEADKMDQQVLTVNIRKGSSTNQDFHVELHGVNSEAWEMIQDMFLALRPPRKVDVTSIGTVIHDADFVGRIYVKGVYCTSRGHYATGYNFLDLDIGRDRRIPSSWDMDSQISGMWSELTRNNEAHAQQLYGLLKKDQGEAEAMRHAYAPAAAKALAKEFQAEYGESVIPVTSVAEAAELEHLGAKAVVVPRSLGTLLRDSGQFPAKDKLLTEFKTGIEKRVQLHELSEMERHILDKGLKLAIAATDASIGEQLMIVEFRDPQLRGLHRNGEIYVRRSELQSLGSFLVVLIHEYAHFKGADGEKGHVDALQNALEKVINMMVETCA